MKAKHKRMIIVGCCIAWGMISASYFLFCTSLESHLRSSIFSCWYLLCDVSTSFTEPIFKSFHIYSPWETAVCLYLAIQFLIYLFTGWIIARLVYPDEEKH